MFLNIIISVIPSIIVCLIFYLINKDRKSINKFYLILSFVLGGLSSYICYRLEWHFGGYFKEMSDSNLLDVFIYAIFGVAIFEELFKYIISLLFIFLNKIKNSFSILIYCLFTSLGFSCFENLFFYTLKGGVSVAISRLFTSIPSHIFFSIIMSLFIYLFLINKINKKYLFLILGLLFPIIIHALYNTFLYQSISSLYIYSLIVLGISFFVSVIIGVFSYKKSM